MKKARKSFWSEISADEIPVDFMEQIEKMEELYMLYECAIREVKTKLENLNQEMDFIWERNPIQYIHDRLKRPRSIYEKLKRRNLEITVENIWNELSDVAGLSVICSYIDDIYAIAGMLQAQDDVFVLEVKDYLKKPKESGYRSFHMILETPVFLSNKKQMVKVEVQIRTIAMDFWASLEHQLRYKGEASISDSIRQRLKDNAENIYQRDLEMQEIYNQINQMEDSPCYNISKKST